MNINPLLQSEIQRLSWKHFLDGKKYSLELITPFGGIVDEWGEGAYLRFAVEVIEDQEISASTISKNSLVEISLPLRSFERSWFALNPTFRKQITAQDNLSITFKRISERNIQFVTVERRKPSPEHITFADKIYLKKIEPKPRLTIQSKEEY